MQNEFYLKVMYSHVIFPRYTNSLCCRLHYLFHVGEMSRYLLHSFLSLCLSALLLLQIQNISFCWVGLDQYSFLPAISLSTIGLWVTLLHHIFSFILSPLLHLSFTLSVDTTLI